jgi:glycosyltransferase involved in cell wall biosynthesis
LKHLVLLCDHYPNSNGEFFLDDEMNVIADNFEQITIICSSHRNDLSRPTPKNVTVVDVLRFSSFQKLISMIGSLFFLPLWKEFFSLSHYRLRPNLTYLKLLISDYVKSCIILKSIKSNQLNDGNKFVYYAYWHDYKALAIARLKEKTNCVAVARCHRWDLYLYVHKLEYLPYKKYILKNLSYTASISQDGINYMLDTHGYEFKDKLKLSRLGKLNNRLPNYDKKNNQFIICSCSHFNSIKRVHLIPQVLKNITKTNIKWIHFGWGYAEYEKMVHDELACVDFDFELMGIVDNQKILDFYRDNYVDIFISTSVSEGIPVSIMEALSSGIPVCATDVGGVSEIVNEDSGFLIPKDFNLIDVAQQLENYLLQSNEQQIQKRKAARFQWELNYNAKKNYNEFIKDILADDAQ